jgi:hypothetical protein
VSTSSTVGRTVEPITAVCVILQSWHCAGLSLATQSGPTENCSNSLRLSVFASLGLQTALSSLPPLRFALPASLAYRPKPSWLGRSPEQSLRCALPASLAYRPRPSWLGRSPGQSLRLRPPCFAWAPAQAVRGLGVRRDERPPDPRLFPAHPASLDNFAGSEIGPPQATRRVHARDGGHQSPGLAPVPLLRWKFLLGISQRSLRVSVFTPAWFIGAMQGASLLHCRIVYFGAGHHILLDRLPARSFANAKPIKTLSPRSPTTLLSPPGKHRSPIKCAERRFCPRLFVIVPLAIGIHTARRVGAAIILAEC